MSKIFEDKVIPEHIRSEFKNLKCDLCKKESDKYKNWANDPTWHKKEVIIKIEEGSTYPQDNYGYFQEIDLCPSCFNERLIPWLKHEGAKINDPVDW